MLIREKMIDKIVSNVINLVNVNIFTYTLFNIYFILLIFIPYKLTIMTVHCLTKGNFKKMSSEHTNVYANLSSEITLRVKSKSQPPAVRCIYELLLIISMVQQRDIGSQMTEIKHYFDWLGGHVDKPIRRQVESDLSVEEYNFMTKSYLK